jgi:putative membrane protein
MCELFIRKNIVLIGVVVVGVLPCAAMAKTDRSAEDQAFVNDAARGGELEVKLGQLAEQNGSAAAVKEFGSRMVKDHTRLNAELSATAKSVGLTVPDTISSGQQAEYDKLAKVKGAKFDTQYINVMVRDHTEDLAAFQKEAKATRDAKLKGAVEAAIPVIEDHLKMAKNDSTKLAAR